VIEIVERAQRPLPDPAFTSATVRGRAGRLGAQGLLTVAHG